MTCRFCGQRNLGTAKRCLFCQNAFDATEDATASGGLRVIAVTLPKANMHEQAASGGKRFEIIDIAIWAVILFVAATVGIVCPF